MSAGSFVLCYNFNGILYVVLSHVLEVYMNNRITISIVKILNPLLVTGVFFLIWRFYYSLGTVVTYWWRGEIVIVGIFFVLYTFLAHFYNGFWVHINRANELIYSQLVSLIISSVIMYFIMLLLWKQFPSVIPIVVAVLIQTAIIIIWTNLSIRWYRKTHNRKKTVLIWDERTGLDGLLEEKDKDVYFDIVGTYSVDQYFAEPKKILEMAEIVFLCDVHSHDRNQILKECLTRGKTAYVIPRIGDTIMMGSVNTHLLHLPILFINNESASIEYLITKRMFDIVVSIIGLIVLSPIMLITSILIKLYDKGTVFYRQKRLTKNGKVFEIIKFRSMKMDAEKTGQAILASSNDDRITPIGKVIRTCRIDELPQLINIIKGDMSIIGPRPERPEIVEQYSEELPEFSLRLRMRAGLTGYAQVYGKYNTTPYDKLLMDLIYISKASIAEDIKIMLATIKILFVPESTEGVDSLQTTAMKKTDKDGVDE